MPLHAMHSTSLLPRLRPPRPRISRLQTPQPPELERLRLLLGPQPQRRWFGIFGPPSTSTSAAFISSPSSCPVTQPSSTHATSSPTTASSFPDAAQNKPRPTFQFATAAASNGPNQRQHTVCLFDGRAGGLVTREGARGISREDRTPLWLPQRPIVPSPLGHWVQR
jgi:hypothetical protein